jgi:hypothetical protein
MELLECGFSNLRMRSFSSVAWFWLSFLYIRSADISLGNWRHPIWIYVRVLAVMTEALCGFPKSPQPIATAEYNDVSPFHLYMLILSSRWKLV